LVRQIAQRHGGDVVYDPEQGSSFTVSLPATPEAAASPARTHSSI